MQNRQHPSGNRFYVAYRKIRYLSKTGSLFSLSKPGTVAKTEVLRETFRTIAINSSLLFIIAYLIIYFLNLLITGYTAILFNIPVVIYYHDVDFLIRGVDWNPDSVSGVFSSGPIAMFTLSIFLLILYKAVETETGILRLLLLWMIFHTLTRFFGEILVGAILNKGFGYVILYMFVMDTGKVVLVILGFVAMFTVGLFMTRQSLYSANIYFNDLHRVIRTQFIVNQFILPFLVGNLVIFLIKIPRFSFYDVCLNGSMILILIPILVRSYGMEDLYFDEERKETKLKIIIPAIMLFMLFLFRLGLGFGLRL